MFSLIPQAQRALALILFLVTSPERTLGESLPLCTKALKAIIFVDLYSSSSALTERARMLFGDNPIQFIHIQTKSSIPDWAASSFKPSAFDHLIVEPDSDDLLETLRPYEILGVVPGTDLGIVTADRLGRRLLLPSNDPKTSRLRREKALQHQRLSDLNLPFIPQIVSNDLGTILQWVESQNKKFPVIVKPPSSGGSEDVFTCYTAECVALAFHQIYLKKNCNEEINTEVLVQAFEEGTEYFVESITEAGRHEILHIWKYVKEKSTDGKAPLPFVAELLHDNDEMVSRLKAYALNVLNAMDVEFGASHIEIIDRADGRGLVLVEHNPRMGGVGIPRIAEKATGIDELGMLLRNYLGQPLPQIERSKSKHARIVLLRAETDGLIMTEDYRKAVAAISSVIEYKISPTNGTRLNRTTGIDSALGYAFLLSDDQDKIERDLSQLLKLQPEDLRR